MDNLNLRNLQLSYQAVYDETLCESMDELGLFGEYDYIDEGRIEELKSKYIQRYGKPEGKETQRQNVTRRKYLDAAARKQQGRGPDPNASIPGKLTRGQMMYKAHRSAEAMRGEEVELYNLILEYLIDEGYADSIDSAEVIIENMSDEWIDDILDEGAKGFPVMKVAHKAAKLIDSPNAKERGRALRMTDPDVTQIPWDAYKGTRGSLLRNIGSLRDYAKLIAKSARYNR